MWYKRSKVEDLHKARGFNMKKNDWMYFVNVLLFVDICSVFAIGLLLALVIVLQTNISLDYTGTIGQTFTSTLRYS